MSFHDVLIDDFRRPEFQTAFRTYFEELGETVEDWDGLFDQMNSQGGNLAFLRLTEQGQVVGFLQFCPMTFSSWFFQCPAGFIREFWIAEHFRRQGHGAHLLDCAEAYFRERGVRRILLTSDTAGDFYLRRGYRRAEDLQAKNGFPVYIRELP